MIRDSYKLNSTHRFWGLFPLKSEPNFLHDATKSVGERATDYTTTHFSVSVPEFESLVDSASGSRDESLRGFCRIFFIQIVPFTNLADLVGPNSPSAYATATRHYSTLS